MTYALLKVTSLDMDQQPLLPLQGGKPEFKTLHYYPGNFGYVPERPYLKMSVEREATYIQQYDLFKNRQVLICG